MSLTWARLTLRLSRFELLAFGGFVALIHRGDGPDGRRASTLFARRSSASVNFEAPPVGCELKSNAWYEAQSGVAGLSMGLLIFLSFAAGLFLGVPVVARELERGTARLAWSLAPSRMRWFLARMLPLLVLLAIVAFLAGVATDRFVASTTAETDLSNSFTAFGFRGLLIASRAVFVFAVGVAVGAVVARALPGIILAAVIATIGLAGGARVHQMILASEAVAIPMDPERQWQRPGPGDLYIDQKFVLPGRQPRRLRLLRWRGPVRRIRDAQVPDRDAGRPGRALPVRRDARGAGPGRWFARRARAGGVRRLEATAGLSA